MQIFEIFNKEKSAERKSKLKEELQRGYFDDFRDFRDSGGKVFLAPKNLVAGKEAHAFPQMQVFLPDGSEVLYPPSAGACGGETPGVSLVCAAFRAGAQDMLEAWSRPFGEQFQGRSQVHYYELALIESSLMSMFPFRSMMLRSAAAAASASQLPLKPRHLFHFGSTDGIRSQLFMANKLTGYIYLLDAQQRIRWRASGNPTEQELQSLSACTQQLLQQQSS